MSTEQNPRDRLFDPDPDTADFRDREDGPEPKDETEDTVRDPAAHRPTVADPDQQTSDAIAAEAAAAPDDAADDRRVEDNTGDDEAAGLSDSPDNVTAVSSPASDDAIDRIDKPSAMGQGERAEGDQREGEVDRQSPRSSTDLDEALDMSREQPSDGAPGDEERPVEGDGALLTGAEASQLRIRWREVQLGFVDDPRQAVDDAAELVSTAVDRVASLLRDQVGALDANKSSRDADGGEPETERLRTLMRRYHALLDRMLAV